MQQPKALLFDLNGTMINDMEFHTEAWSNVINDLGGNLTYPEVKSHMYGKNREVLIRVFGEGKFTEEEMNKISYQKEEAYQKVFRPHLKLIDGLHELLEKAKTHNVPVAIGSAAIMFNIDYVLDNLDVRHYFKAIVSADDCQNGKPHPEVFMKGADLLKVDYKDCIVFEDAPKGVEAARNAGMKSVVLTTYHDEEEFKGLDNVLCFIKDYTDPKLYECLSFLNK